MIVSFTLPTRKRVPQLSKALNSIYNTCHNKENFEVLLAVDIDDLETIDFVKNFTINHPNTLLFLFERQGYKGMHVYNNTLLKHAGGNLIWFFNDDAEMGVKNWDLILEEYINQFKVINPLVPSMSHYVRNESIPNYCWTIFPIIPKKWFHLTGRLSNHAACDSWVSEVVYNANIPFVNDDRLIVEHYRFDETGLNYDETYIQREQDISITRPDFISQYQIDERIKDIEIIKNYLEKENTFHN